MLIRSILGALALSASAVFGGAASAESYGDKAKPKVVLGGFVGVTDSKYGTEFTFGVEGFYKASDKIKVGIIWELLPDAGDGKDANLVLGAVSLNVTDHFRVIGGAGKDYHGGKEHGVWRTGAAYDFKVGKFMISPTAAIDWFENRENYIGGITIARKF